MFFINKDYSLQSRLFIAGTIVAIFACIFDGISYAIDGQANLLTLLYISNGLGIMLAPVLTTVFIFFFTAYIGNYCKVSWKIPIIVLCIVIITSIIGVIGIVNGSIFYIEDGIFKEGEMYNYVGSPSILSLIVVLIIDIKHKKDLEKGDFLAILIYVLIPIFAKVLEVIIPGMGFVYPLSSIGILLLYILLQKNKISTLALRESILKELSHKDDLTGLGNRRAFMEKIGRIKGDETIVAIFCDINGLKHVNDTYGHIEGDNYIKRFVHLLMEHFGKELLFRISGDEFVVIIPKADSHNAKDRLERFKNAISAASNIASVGSAIGKADDITILLNKAESAMYEDKNAYYQMEGSHRR